MIAIHLRLRLVLLRATARSLDRSKRIVLLFGLVVLGQFTVTDPGLWIAPLRPLLLAPDPVAGGFAPSLALGLFFAALGVMARPVFDWTAHSRILAQVGTSRLESTIGDASIAGLLTMPFAAVLTAGLVVRVPVDVRNVATLVLFVVLLAAWLRLAAASMARACVAIGATAAVIASIGSRVDATVLLTAALLIAAVVATVPPRWTPRLAHRIARHAWRTGSPSIDVWLRLHGAALRERSPWLFAPTLALAVVAIERRASAAIDPGDAIRLVAGLLLLWQLAASTSVAADAMRSWNRSRVLLQLPRRMPDRLLRVTVASAVLFAGASPAEAMSLGISHNDAAGAWTCLLVAAPWIAAWAQSRSMLRGVFASAASIAVVLFCVGTV